MPKCLIAYFSQGGTTALVAERISEGLRGQGYQVDLCNIRDTRMPSVDNYDLLGVGLPTHYYRAPFNVTDYVINLPKLSGKPAFVFVLSGGMKGDSGNNIRRILARKGAKDAGYFSCFGADFYLGFLLEGYLLTPDNPTKEELGKAEGFGCEVAERVNKKDFTSQPYDPALPSLAFRLQRLMTSRPFVRFAYSRMFSLKKEKCNSCGICMKTCPTGNIKADKSGQPVWGRNCILCFYCDMKCPQEAIVSCARSSLQFQRIHKYNLRTAFKYREIKYARVNLKAGKVERIKT